MKAWTYFRFSVKLLFKVYYCYCGILLNVNEEKGIKYVATGMHLKKISLQIKLLYVGITFVYLLSSYDLIRIF